MAAPFCLPSGTGDLGRYWAAKVQGPGAKFSQRAKRAPGEKFASLVPGAQRRPWPCAQRTAGHNRKPEGKPMRRWARRAPRAPQALPLVWGCHVAVRAQLGSALGQPGAASSLRWCSTGR